MQGSFAFGDRDAAYAQSQTIGKFFFTCLEQQDVDACAGQEQRGGRSGRTAANHDYTIVVDHEAHV